MKHSLSYRSLWSLDTLGRRDISVLLETAFELKHAAQSGTSPPLLRGKNVALLSENPLGPSAMAFHAAASDLGARVAIVPAPTLYNRGLQTLRDTARLLGRLYAAIECQDMPVDDMRELDLDAGVPTFNGWGAPDHPTTVLADVMTLQEFSGSPLDSLAVAFTGDRHSAGAATFLHAMVMCDARVRMRVEAKVPQTLEPGRTSPVEAEDDVQMLGVSCPGGMLPLKLHVPYLSDTAVAVGQSINRRYVIQALLACAVT